MNNLIDYFKKFPGIGERQARRFVYFLLNENETNIKNLIQNIIELKKNTSQCPSCFRYAELKNELCQGCLLNEDSKILVIIEKDADLEILRQSDLGAKYFIIGNLENSSIGSGVEQTGRQKELINKIKKENISEIILAFSLTPRAQYAEEFLRQTLTPIITQNKIKISSLGRGLSTGLELEYSDTETLKNALKNRA